MKHDNLIPFAGSSWIAPLDKAFDILKKDILPELKVLKGVAQIFPAESLVLKAFKDTPYDRVELVILGMDPYPNSSAIGSAFDNLRSTKPSPSLRNILKEIETDFGRPSIAFNNTISYLEHLPPQGVLLLNTALTVRVDPGHGSGSHSKLWAPFTEEVIKALNKKPKLVWLLMGNDAKAYAKVINPKHVLFQTAHPSPFAYKKFKGCGVFKAITKLTSIQF